MKRQNAVWFGMLQICARGLVIPISWWLQDLYTEDYKTETIKEHINKTGNLYCVYGSEDFVLLSDQFFPN